MTNDEIEHCIPDLPLKEAVEVVRKYGQILRESERWVTPELITERREIEKKYPKLRDFIDHARSTRKPVLAPRTY